MPKPKVYATATAFRRSLEDRLQQIAKKEDVVARLKKHGAELVGKIAQYEDIYRLCYIRGPEDIILGLAEQLGKKDIEW